MISIKVVVLIFLVVCLVIYVMYKNGTRILYKQVEETCNILEGKESSLVDNIEAAKEKCRDTSGMISAFTYMLLDSVSRKLRN